MYDGAMSTYWMNEVIICQGSNYRNRGQRLFSSPLPDVGLTNKKLAMKYNPVVARREMTIFRKIALLNTSSSCN